MSVRIISDAALPASKGKAATINDIARLSGVSKKTVSRIINNSPLVRKDTRDKVEALMREVGYVPDPLARGLAFRRSFLIGLVYDDPGAQCIVDLQHGALEALRGTGYELVVHPCDSQDPECPQGVRRFVQQQKLHGVILSRVRPNRPRWRRCSMTSIAATCASMHMPRTMKCRRWSPTTATVRRRRPVTCSRWATATSR